jgi:hypothetical protein
VARLLLEREASQVHERNAHSQLPLHLACERGACSCAELVIAAGSDLDAPDVQGCTPLMRACLCGSAALVGLLLERGAARDAVDAMGMPAMYRAAVEGHRACLSLMLHARASLQPSAPNVRLLINVEGRAERNGHRECVRLLREAQGAHVARLLAPDARVRIVPASPLVQPALAFLTGLTGRALSHSASSDECSVRLDDARYTKSSIRVHALALEVLDGADGTATDERAAPSQPPLGTPVQRAPVATRRCGVVEAAEAAEAVEAAEERARVAAARLLAEEGALKPKMTREGRAKVSTLRGSAARPRGADERDAEGGAEAAAAAEDRQQQDEAAKAAERDRDRERESARQEAERAARQAAAAAAADRARAAGHDGKRGMDVGAIVRFAAANAAANATLEAKQAAERAGLRPTAALSSPEQPRAKAVRCVSVACNTGPDLMAMQATLADRPVETVRAAESERMETLRVELVRTQSELSATKLQLSTTARRLMALALVSGHSQPNLSIPSDPLAYSPPYAPLFATNGRTRQDGGTSLSTGGHRAAMQHTRSSSHDGQDGNRGRGHTAAGDNCGGTGRASGSNGDCGGSSCGSVEEGQSCERTESRHSRHADAGSEAAVTAYRTLVNAARQSGYHEQSVSDVWAQITWFGLQAFGFAPAGTSMPVVPPLVPNGLMAESASTGHSAPLSQGAIYHGPIGQAGGAQGVWTTE